MSKHLDFKLPNHSGLKISIDNHLCGFIYDEEIKIPLPKGDWMIVTYNTTKVRLINFDNE